MHIFLTGAVGCGKSTVIDRVLAACPFPVGGFRSGFGPNRGNATRALYLWPAGEAPQYDRSHIVARFDSTGVKALAERFDDLGTSALVCPGAGLILMDECGRLEQQALRLQAAVLEALDGKVPVLGVVRHGLPGWTGAIGAHPRVALLEVTKENRDSIAEKIKRALWV